MMTGVGNSRITEDQSTGESSKSVVPVKAKDGNRGSFRIGSLLEGLRGVCLSQSS